LSEITAVTSRPQLLLDVLDIHDQSHQRTRRRQ